MKELTGNQVRQMFLDYFQSKGHMIEPGASLIPHNDPTLLWINAGVAALKKYFDGSEKVSVRISAFTCFSSSCASAFFSCNSLVSVSRVSFFFFKSR